MNPKNRIMEKKLLSRYQQSVMDKREFRNQMKAELKALAKQSFVEEFEMWKQNSTIRNHHNLEADSFDGKSTNQLEQEIRYLQHVVDNLQNSQSLHSSPLQWSSPIARDQQFSPNRRNHTTSLFPESSDEGTNNFFVLSSAPIGGFDSLIHQQIQSRESSEPVPGSLLEQAHRFAEINALFHMPESLSEEENWFKKQFDDYHAQAEAHRLRNKEAQKVQKVKLEESVEMHKGRLEKARNVPRRFPLEIKPSHTASPRQRVHRYSTPGASAPNAYHNMNSATMPFPNTNTAMSNHNNNSGNHHTETNDNITLSSTEESKVFMNEVRMNAAAMSSPPSPSTNVNAFNSTIDTQAESPPVKEAETLTVAEFEKKTAQLSTDVQKLVRDTVHNEMLRDGKAHHYTQRVQNLIINKHEELLVKKIEKNLEFKLTKLKEELETLKQSKLKTLNDEKNGQFVAGQDLRTILGEKATPEDVQNLTQDIKKIVSYALRSHFGKGQSFAEEEEEEEKLNSGSDNKTKVHGRIGVRNSFSEEPVIVLPVVNNANNALVEEVIVKPKSKADRLLGISTDVKSGLPINDPPAASMKPQSGFLGSIGGLFSSKPGSTMDPSLMSSKPAASMFSTRNSPGPLSNSFMAKMQLEPIIDENEEEKKSVHIKSSRSGDDSSTGPSNKADSGIGVLQIQIQGELSAEEIVYRDLMANLLALADVKNNVKKELKDWENDFKNKNGREPSAEDKMAINDRFLAYKMVCNQVTEAKDHVKASEDKMKEIKLRLAAAT